ncbi:hypothetical protein N0V90_005832 [Kalmusia sp. IMI 367209]|nr:hypothetical protein N0V90_005832 [Kalmusia sp. IMI 367209]
MVNIIKRMRKLRELLWIRNGPGSLVLPKEVTKISLEFHTKLIGGQHRGARYEPSGTVLPPILLSQTHNIAHNNTIAALLTSHFWHEMLPRIKYRNPSVPISVTRHTDPAAPAYLHIYTSPPSSDPSATPPSGTPDASAPTHTIDVKTKHESEILDALLEHTGATVLQAPPAEVEEMREIEEFKERAEKDRVDVREKLMKERREQELLRLARGEAATTA